MAVGCITVLGSGGITMCGVQASDDVAR